MEDEIATVGLSSNLTSIVERVVKEEVQRVFLSFLNSAGLLSLTKPTTEEYSSYESTRPFEYSEYEEPKYRKKVNENQEYIRNSAGLLSPLKSNADEYSSNTPVHSSDYIDSEEPKYRKKLSELQGYNDDKDFRNYQNAKPKMQSYSYLSFQMDRQTERPPYYYGSTKKPAHVVYSAHAHGARPTYSSSLDEDDYARYIDSDILAYLKSFI